ncbi:unnamed protein product [Calypogeia fissa]
MERLGKHGPQISMSNWRKVQGRCNARVALMTISKTGPTEEQRGGPSFSYEEEMIPYLRAFLRVLPPRLERFDDGTWLGGIAKLGETASLQRPFATFGLLTVR